MIGAPCVEVKVLLAELGRLGVPPVSQRVECLRRATIFPHDLQAAVLVYNLEGLVQKRELVEACVDHECVLGTCDFAAALTA